MWGVLDPKVAWEIYVKETVKEAEARCAKGIIELCEELHWSDEETLKRLQQILQISQEEAKKYLDIFNRTEEIETASNDELSE